MSIMTYMPFSENPLVRVIKAGLTPFAFGVRGCVCCASFAITAVQPGCSD